MGLRIRRHTGAALCLSAAIAFVAADMVTALGIERESQRPCANEAQSKKIRRREGGRRIDIQLEPCVMKVVAERILRLIRLGQLTNHQAPFANGRVPEMPKIDYTRIVAIRVADNERFTRQGAEYEVMTVSDSNRGSGILIGVTLNSGEPKLLWALGWIE